MELASRRTSMKQGDGTESRRGKGSHARCSVSDDIGGVLAFRRIVERPRSSYERLPNTTIQKLDGLCGSWAGRENESVVQPHDRENAMTVKRDRGEPTPEAQLRSYIDRLDPTNQKLIRSV